MRWIVSAILAGRGRFMLCAFVFCAATTPALAKGDPKSTPLEESTRHVSPKHQSAHKSAQQRHGAHKQVKHARVHRHAHTALAFARHRPHGHVHAGRDENASFVQAAQDDHRSGERQVGQASWYGQEHIGRRTATGERFDPDLLTAAHPTLPLNTTVRVKNLANGRVVTVRINDRSAQTGHRIIDLSPRAADLLDMRRAGVAPVAVERVAPELALAR